MKVVKFLVKMILTLALMAFGGYGWYLAMGLHFDRMRKTISAKRAKETGSKCHPVPYADTSVEERHVVAENNMKSVKSGWKWMIETA